MPNEQINQLPTRPPRLAETPVPPIPNVGKLSPELASTKYSAYRTGLSNHRTGLSEHRTQLSEFRTDLSTHRTDLSTERTEMSMRRTGMSFQRTRMSADRTLMSVIRTSLSLISFGFTIYQVFEKLREAGTFMHAAAPRNFGLTLLLIGVLMLIGGIVYHVMFMLGLRRERRTMREAGLVHAESGYPVSLTLITALVLLGVGLMAIVSIVFNVAPFGGSGAG